MKARLALIGATLVLAGCGTATTSPAAIPSPTVAARATAAPPTPEPASPAEAAAEHITKSVTRLMNIDDATRIDAWVDVEGAWLDKQNLPVLRPYLVAFTGVLIKRAYEEDANRAVMALDIIAAARQVPGVRLP